MFVLPQIWSTGSPENTTQDSWVANCTKIVHGSMKPFDGSSCRTEDHWLRYDRGSGQTTFSNGWGTVGFDIGYWLDIYRVWAESERKTEKVQPVNCYDQATATEYVLCLGVPHTQINWEYHQVFGFINHGTLVGWGTCNNPYTWETPKLVTTAEDASRTPFRNHAYLSWSYKSLTADHFEFYTSTMSGVKTHAQYQDKARQFDQYPPSPLKMIDACAGPALGVDTRDKYEGDITEVVDPENSIYTYVRKNFKNFLDTESHCLSPGVSYLDREAGWLKQFSEPQQERWTALYKHTLGILVETGSERKVSQEDVNQIQQEFMNFIDSQPDWDGHKRQAVPVRDYVTGRETHVSEIKYTMSDDHATIQTASLRIARNNVSESLVREICAGHLAYIALTSNVELDITNRGTIQADGHQSISVAGTNHRRVFVWRNLAVEVYITTDAAWGGGDMNDNTVMQRVFEKAVQLEK